MRNDLTGAPSRGVLRRLRLPLSIVILCFSFATAQFASAANERTLSFYNVNTGQTHTVTFKRNGQYIAEGLAQANYILRDWRQDEPTQMDPRLLDLVWELYQQTGSREPISIISAYRSPTTNEMLRSNSNGVAQNSQHIQGKAMDIQFPDVDLATLRAAALRMQIGGVGFYPGSGVPFVHVDTGSVRHWPRMTRNELAAVFPDGHSLHIPSDGTPLPGYNEAQVAYQQRGDEVVALFGVPSEDNTRLAGLFDRDPAPAAAVAPAATPAPVAVAATIAPTLFTTAPAPRPDLPGVTVIEPQPRADALAFAPETTPDHDPLQILTQQAEPEPVQTAALTTPAAVLNPGPMIPTIQRRWYDPIATAIIPPTRVGSTLPFLSQTTTTRQAAFVQLTLPYVDASPQFLAMPERVIEGGFLQPTVTASSSHFVIAEGVAPQMIDLTRLGTVALR